MRGAGAVRVVHHEGALALHVAAVAHLALTGAEVAGRLHLLDVGVGADRLEQRNRLGRLGNGLRRLVDDQGHFGHGLHGVAARHQQRGHGGRRERRADRVALLLEVDAAVPAAPRLVKGRTGERRGHGAEGALARAVRTADRGTRGNLRSRRRPRRRRATRRRSGDRPMGSDGVRLAVVFWWRGASGDPAETRAPGGMRCASDTRIRHV